MGFYTQGECIQGICTRYYHLPLPKQTICILSEYTWSINLFWLWVVAKHCREHLIFITVTYPHFTHKESEAQGE